MYLVYNSVVVEFVGCRSIF